MAKIEPIEFDKYPIWNKQTSETDDAYDRFYQWFLPQIKGSLLGAYRTYCEAQKDEKGHGKLAIKDVPQSWRIDAEQYRWKERHRAYWRKVAQENLEWQRERLRELTEIELNLANQLFDKANQLLNMPVNPEVDRLKDSTNLIRTAGELARRSLGYDGLSQAIDKVNRSGLLVVDPTLECNKTEDINDDTTTI